MREQLIKRSRDHPASRSWSATSPPARIDAAAWASPRAPSLPRSIIEFYYKNDALNDPMVSEEHVTAFGWASPQEIDDIMALAIRVNDFLSGLFLGCGIRLVDFKMECGRLWEGEMMRIVVADEISPDSCRLWDIKSNDKLDKDRFRRDMGRPRRGLHRGRAAPRHHAGKRDAASQRAQAGPIGKRRSLSSQRRPRPPFCGPALSMSAETVGHRSSKRSPGTRLAEG